MKFKSILLFLFVGNCIVNSHAQAFEIKANIKDVLSPVQPTMYGIFFEDINFAADGGLYPELIKNRSFEFEDPKMAWKQPKSDRYSLNKKSGFASAIRRKDTGLGHSYLHVDINDPKGFELENEGFRGIALEAGKAYRLSAHLSNEQNEIKKVSFSVVNAQGEEVLQGSFNPKGAWNYYEAIITASKTVDKGKLVVQFDGKGSIDMDMISLFPTDTWKGRKNGLRKDLVQLLYDMKPGFLRFPGGCIVEGRTLAQRYQWKKTVGPVEDRTTLVNRWNTEFAHKPTPDYFQSFGLGFYEYFQLSEDVGATPLPILSCGMACQFNTAEMVPLDELDPYVQDALDLIEFANGGEHTPWGKLRADMGHPAPFNLKMIGVGNEQWGPEYFERYVVFEKAIKAKYPEIKIISGSGPFAEGEQFEYGWSQLMASKADLVDEHYYKVPSWFRENAGRYDSYDRKGPKIFAGEYAAQSVATVSPENKNNWECALSEAAFMTGLERNADIVHMTSYAPLMAHEEGWQWTPDLIWFNNLKSYGSANYYIQKMFANHRGDQVIKVSNNGQAIKGQQDIFASMVEVIDSQLLYLKIANTSKMPKTITLILEGGKFEGAGSGLIMQSEKLDALNSFESPMKVSPQKMAFEIKKNKIETSLPGQSFSIYYIPIKKKNK